MSKVEVIWSSPNKDGLTACAKEQFLKGLRTAGAEVEEIHYRSYKMRKYLLFLILSVLLGLSGCTSGLSTEQESGEVASVSEETTEKESLTEEVSTEEPSETDEKEIYSNGEMEFVLPEDWKDKCVVVTSDESIVVYQKASYEVEEESGFLCAVIKEENEVSIPEYYEIACSDEAIYYLCVPSDVPCVEEPKISAEYVSMVKYYQEIEDCITIKGNDLYFEMYQFVCPMSKTREIPDEVLANLMPRQLLYARNEIYARHGRIFTNQHLKERFEGFSWYLPAIEPEDFDESILSDVEKKNIEKIVALEKQYKEKHILQEPLAFGMEYSFDLDGDGTPETLCLRYKSMENYHDYAVEVLINGKCVMGADEWVVTLETRGYYVTDIDENNPGLEIAISDYGESDDPATHFFYYDGKLNYIGYVDNMLEEKYTEKNKILTGFNGKVEGYIRADVFYSCFAYAQWQYSYQDKTIQMMEQDMYELCPDKSYELTEDIQIYKQKSTDSKCITLKAQNVYFLESDRDLWMKVKGEDGVTGYLYRNEDWDVDGTGKHAEEIFVNLPFFG